MKIQLSDHFTYSRLFKFVLSSVIMMIFISMYSVVDGLFISNCVGSNALASINIIYPLIMIIGAFGFMLGTGGGAEISKTLGQGDNQKANRYFTMLIIVDALVGVILSIVCIVFIEPISYLMGASTILVDDCITYGRILLIGTALFMLQNAFQTFFIVAEKPHLGLALTIISGVTNMLLDFLFVYIFKWGIAGAGLATISGYAVGSIIPMFYFLSDNDSKLRFIKTKFYPRMLLHSCVNGSSEMLTNISMSIVTLLYNKQMMNLVGEDGVASITVIMYVNFVFVATFIGFSIGTAPIISYNYGSDNHTELKNMFSKSLKIILITSIIMIICAELVSRPLVSLFLGNDNELSNMTVHGFRLYSLSFLICGINIYSSSFFTSLCNGLISAIISTLRSLIMQVIMILLLPLILGIDGIWLSIVFSELITCFFSIYFLISNRKKYHYM